MNTTNKKPRKDIWKVVLMALEVVVIVLLVLFVFTYSWSEATSRHANNRRPDLNDTSIADFQKKILYFPRQVPKERFDEKQEDEDEPVEPLSFEEQVIEYVFDICESYPNVDPYIVLSVIYQESRFTPNVSSGKCVGLMQVSTYHHQDRAKRLGVTDFYDPYSNILLGVDLLNELLNSTNGDIYKALTRYNGGSIIGKYAKDVVNRANEYREGYFYAT